VQARIAADLSAAARAPVAVELLEPRDWPSTGAARDAGHGDR
jgi:hypothetical protein